MASAYPNGGAKRKSRAPSEAPSACAVQQETTLSASLALGTSPIGEAWLVPV